MWVQMRRVYSGSFRDRMVRRLSGPGAVSASSLSVESGVSQGTLSRWLLEAGTGNVGGMKKPAKKPDGGEGHGAQRNGKAKPTASEKLRAVIETASLTESELGEYLRREGLHEADVRLWRQMAEGALGNEERVRADERNQRALDAKRVKELERELRRKDAALAETAALLVLKKKVLAIWGDEDDSTPRKSGQ